jgi:hypothetical protein
MEIRNAQRIFVEILKGKNYLGYLDEKQKIILQWVSQKQTATLWLVFTWFRTGPVAAS